ncbi:MAG: hypothetical protein QMD04_08735 [Anaerolineales bacterium]|nr:hypothetical protein [Anaerolineales bacterium]
MNNLIKRTAPPKYQIDMNLSLADTYSALEFYYHNNGLYALIQQDLMTNGLWTEGMVGLRNPAHRVVEFYVAKLWPGKLSVALPIVTTNENIIEPIHKIWEWSNWGSAKQVAARWFALYGDMFIKVAAKAKGPGEPASQVFFQNIKPMYVTDITADERGYLTRIRIDIPRIRKGETIQTYFYTEIWDKSTQLYRRWENNNGPGTSEDRLGQPIEERPFSDFGIDFIPIVHAKFQDVGEPRGIGAFTHALDKIDEANRMATRLHQLLFRFNDVIFAVSANMVDGSGRPLPAPSLELGDDQMGDSQTMTVGTGTKVARLPGNSKLEMMVPDLKYADALEILNAHMRELERDLPEMAYYRMREQGRDLSGRAIRLLLSDTVDKVLEARGNAETALARADAMALTIGINLELFDKNIGAYDLGSFDHTFKDREVIPLSELEKREIALLDKQLGVSEDTLLTRLGYDPSHEREMRENEASELGEKLLTAFDKDE